MIKKCFFKWIFFVFMGCCACSNLSKSSSTNIIPMDSVASLIADCLFIESEIYVIQWKYDLQDYSSVKYDSLFEKHGLTKEVFVENVNYYFTHEKYANIIMERLDTIVEQRVAALRDSLDLKP